MNYLEKLNEEEMHELEKQLRVLSHGAIKVIPKDELKRKIARSIKTKIPLNIKLGLDPTALDLHIGHIVVLKKLKQFQEFGHSIQLIIGDFTGKIGDPTGRSVTRKALTDKEVNDNAKTYFRQLSKVINMNKVELYYNSDWLSKMDFIAILQLAGNVTVARMLERKDFNKRYRESQPIYLQEFFYPILQGYDSYVLKSDIELGGSDQEYNVLFGRQVQGYLEEDKQTVLLLPLLEGLDGIEKMSKSEGNYIGINEDPNEIFGKIMSIPDQLIIKYFELVSNLSLKEIDEIQSKLEKGFIHPRDAKISLAYSVVEMLYDKLTAKNSKENFINIFSKRKIPKDIPEIIWHNKKEIGLVNLVVELGLLSSKSEVRRMIKNGGIRINQVKVNDPLRTLKIEDVVIIQVGKRKFMKIRPG